MHVVDKVVDQRNDPGKKIEQQHSPSPPGLKFGNPPEQAQRESDHSVKCGASKNHDLIMKLAEPLGWVGALQQNGGFVDVEDVSGQLFLIVDPLGGDRLVCDRVGGLPDDPPAGICAILIVGREFLVLLGGRIAGFGGAFSSGFADPVSSLGEV